MDPGFRGALGREVQNPLPNSWLGLYNAPPSTPSWATIGTLTSVQVTNLQAQLGYDLSNWDYTMVGKNNQLGRYQFNSKLLEAYGLIAAGSNAVHGANAVNYAYCWTPVYLSNTQYPYENYYYDVTSQQSFLTNTVSQEHLAYQRLVDIYIGLTANNSITANDTPDVVAGMIYVGWTNGIGKTPDAADPVGSGAYAWRYFGVGECANSFNSGRYAINVLSQ